MPPELHNDLAARPRPRWTIRTLLILTACVASLIAAISVFPSFFGFVFAICLMFCPSIVIAAVSILYSNNRDRTIAFHIPIPVLAPLLTPPIMADFVRPLTYWEDVYMGLHGMGMIAAVLSVVAVVLDLTMRFSQSWKAEP